MEKQFVKNIIIMEIKIKQQKKKKKKYNYFKNK